MRAPSVDAYSNGLPPLQRNMCTEFREVAWEVDPAIEPTIKRSVQPHFVLEGNVCVVLATSDRISVFLHHATVPDRRAHQPGHGRQDRPRHPDQPRRAERILRAIVGNNRAGGWRRTKRPNGWPARQDLACYRRERPARHDNPRASRSDGSASSETT